MTTIGSVFEPRQVAREASRLWWLFTPHRDRLARLRTRHLPLRHRERAATVSFLFGVIAIVAGASELLAIAVATRGWKIVHGILGVIFVLVGIFAFLEPGPTFEALAAVIGFFFLFKGVFDITAAIVTRGEFELGWLLLVIGLIEIGLAFWVAGDFQRKVVLLLVYAGVACLSKETTELVLAFKLRPLRTELAS